MMLAEKKKEGEVTQGRDRDADKQPCAVVIDSSKRSIAR